MSHYLTRTSRCFLLDQGGAGGTATTGIATGGAGRRKRADGGSATSGGSGNVDGGGIDNESTGDLDNTDGTSKSNFSNSF